MKIRLVRTVLVAVKHSVSEVIGKKRGESLYLRGTDKKTGKKRYRGTKYDLLEVKYAQPEKIREGGGD